MTRLIVKGRPRRKSPESGDFFSLQLVDPQITYLGRVVRTDARVGSLGNAVVAYVYDTQFPSADQVGLPDLMQTDHLLIPPALVDGRAWSVGQLVHVGHRPFRRGEMLPQHCFKSTIGEAFYDEFGRPLVSASPPIGSWSLANAEALAIEIFQTLRLRTSRGLTIEQLLADQPPSA